MSTSWIVLDVTVHYSTFTAQVSLEESLGQRQDQHANLRIQLGLKEALRMAEDRELFAV